jgi:hypothetical protein
MLRIAALLIDLDNQCFAAFKYKKLSAFLSDLDKKRFAPLKYKKIRSTLKRFR